LRRPDLFRNTGSSVQVDWLGSLPPAQLKAFKTHCKEVESCYVIFSIELNEAITLRDEGSKIESIQVGRLASDLCDQLAENLDIICSSMREHCKEYGTTPSTTALDPECFCCRRVQRWALRSRTLDRLRWSRHSRFVSKLSTLSRIVAASCAHFRRATINLTAAQELGGAESSWAEMDAAHYDLNTCLRELVVMLKCFLRVLSADDLALFEMTLLRLKSSRREGSASVIDFAFHPSS
jgi:hypothetical protein